MDTNSLNLFDYERERQSERVDKSRKKRYRGPYLCLELVRIGNFCQLFIIELFALRAHLLQSFNLYRTSPRRTARAQQEQGCDNPPSATYIVSNAMDAVWSSRRHVVVFGQEINKPRATSCAVSVAVSESVVLPLRIQRKKKKPAVEGLM